MARQNRSLLPPVSQLKNLSEDTVGNLILLADRESSRSTRCAVFGMMCGTLSLLACLGSFTYLAMKGHEKAAGVVLGATVLAVISHMIRSRTT